MDAVLRAASVAAVLALAVPPALEIATIPNANQRGFAALFLGSAAVLGVRAAVLRRPLGARFTTLVYGGITVGFGLFGTGRPLPELLAYVAGLLGMNVLLYHVTAYGTVLAAFEEEDAISRRARGAVLRSLAISGGAVALVYAGSLALLPVFALDLALRDPLTAVVLGIALLLVLLFLALLPEDPFTLRGPRRSFRLR